MKAAAHGPVRRLFGRGSIYTIGTALQLGAALLVVPVLTRILAPAQFGEVAAAIVVLTITSMVCACGLPDAAARRFFDGAEGQQDARRLVIAAAAFACVLGVAADLTGPLWSGLLSLDYTATLRWAVAAGALTGVLFVAQALLRAEDRAWAFLAVLAVSTFTAQGLGLALTSATGSPAGYAAGAAIGTALGLVLAVVKTGALRNGLPRPPSVRAALSLGLPLVPHGLSQYLIASADRIAIAAVLGLAAAGRYQVACSIGSIGVILLMAINQAWLPLLLGTPEERRRRVLGETARAVHTAAVVVAGATALIAPLILPVTAPASFAPDELVPVTAVTAFSVIPYATACTHFHSIFLVGKTRVMAVAAPIAAAVNIGANLVLLPPLGLIAAALATVLAYAVLTLVSVAAARRHATAPGVLGSASLVWLAGAGFVAAGALLPAGDAGTAPRAGVGLALLAYVVLAVGRVWRRPSGNAEPVAHGASAPAGIGA